MILIVLVALIPALYAEIPAPSYRVSLEQGAAAAVAELARDQGLDAARDLAKAWQAELGESAEVAYEMGLACRLHGQDAEARRWLDAALARAPEHVAARYDRGELLLNAGDLEAAQADFEEVVRLAPRRWAGHFRLADIAGRRGDVLGLSNHLTDALRAGFVLTQLVGDPRWTTWLGDEQIGPPLRTLILEYGGQETLDAIERGVRPR